jgi:hypothetical protein
VAYRLQSKARMPKTLAIAILLTLAGLGCGGQRIPRMSFLPRADQHELVPSKGKALMVFLRPSRYGGKVPAILWRDGPEFIGVLTWRTYLAIELDPGSHTFMVQSETGDFLEANLEADKTYFAVVRARPGWNRARFSLSATAPETEDWMRVPEYLAAAREAVTNNVVEEWAAGQRERAALIWETKHPEWMGKIDRPAILAEWGHSTN